MHERCLTARSRHWIVRQSLTYLTDADEVTMYNSPFASGGSLTDVPTPLEEMTVKAFAYRPAVVILLIVCGCQSGLPSPVHTQSMVTTDGYVLSVATESALVKSAWQLNAGSDHTGPSVRIADTLVAIEGGELTVDGKVVATIPSETRAVQIKETDGVVRVSADGSMLYESRVTHP